MHILSPLSAVTTGYWNMWTSHVKVFITWDSTTNWRVSIISIDAIYRFVLCSACVCVPVNVW